MGITFFKKTKKKTKQLQQWSRPERNSKANIAPRNDNQKIAKIAINTKDNYDKFY